jgi:DNA invertase Pin-like site-specific DNA recombinase
MITFAYGRVSKDTQEMSEGSQFEKCEKWFAFKQSLVPDATWGGWFFDEDVSASIPFSERPSGEAIILRANPGDIVVCSNFDRMFRSTLDFCLMLELLNEAGIKLVILDADFDTSTSIGEACMKMISVMKELELKEIGRRTKEGLDQIFKRGGAIGFAPLGWKKIPNTGRKRGEPKALLRPDHQERRLCEEVRKLKDSKRMSYVEITEYLWKKGVRPHRGKKGTYRPGRFRGNTLLNMRMASINGFPRSPSKDLPSDSHASPPPVRATPGASSSQSSEPPSS